ncbi:Replicase protein RepA (plasmid) [Roseomonas mucosa]|uniref:Plasmid encoded RepA protein n=1 Tax=Roseomonas mucosa TaxID=207340 RepID=A0A379PPJ0_9PROT|nr:MULTISPECIES: replication protein RepA [Roseomonas]MBS5905366.1 plasmid replication initiator [Acetobacteraceae bacterium]MCG7353555.1 plasmid replication initiator [Roseomonas mucosa]MCG7358908.1 plasmid replication initiator [Roseomonas mucosa]QDD92736.1 Replicase protein RepA [Roseomonas mucosa]QDD97573.1 Replicase protein RepA [Roseomonas mucosa]
MGTVHRLIETQGKMAALATDIDRRVVEAASSYMADEDSNVGFIYSGWTQAALPHKRLPDDAIWKISSEHVTLLVEPGRRTVDSCEEAEWVGVPYGSRARLILLFLQSEALRTGGREIELGRSLRAWLSRLGIPIGGKSFKDVREQAERISRCRLTFHIRTAGRAGLVNQNIVDTAMFVGSDDTSQGSLFTDTVRLSESFFEQLQKHPVPIEEAAIKALSNNSMALDIYCWLTYRLHVLQSPKPISWKALQGQFGVGYKGLHHFKPRFLENLGLACAVYPRAELEVDERGLTLKPSKSPVMPRLIKA